MFNVANASRQEIVHQARALYNRLEDLRCQIEGSDSTTPEIRKTYKELGATIRAEANNCRLISSRMLKDDIQRNYVYGVCAAAEEGFAGDAEARYIHSFPIATARYRLGRLFFEYPEWGMPN